MEQTAVIHLNQNLIERERNGYESGCWMTGLGLVSQEGFLIEMLGGVSS